MCLSWPFDMRNHFSIQDNNLISFLSEVLPYFPPLNSIDLCDLRTFSIYNSPVQAVSFLKVLNFNCLLNGGNYEEIKDT